MFVRVLIVCDMSTDNDRNMENFESCGGRKDLYSQVVQ